MLELHGAEPRTLHRLRDKRIDIREFLIADIEIDATEHIETLGDRLPVEGHIIIDVEIEVPVQRCDGLLRTTLEVRLVDLMVLSLIIDLKIRIAVNRREVHIPRLPVDAREHDNITERPRTEISVTRIDTEHRHRPVRRLTERFHGTAAEEAANDDDQHEYTGQHTTAPVRPFPPACPPRRVAGPGRSIRTQALRGGRHIMIHPRISDTLSPCVR